MCVRAHAGVHVHSLPGSPYLLTVSSDSLRRRGGGNIRPLASCASITPPNIVPPSLGKLPPVTTRGLNWPCYFVCYSLERFEVIKASFFFIASMLKKTPHFIIFFYFNRLSRPPPPGNCRWHCGRCSAKERRASLWWITALLKCAEIRVSLNCTWTAFKSILDTERSHKVLPFISFRLPGRRRGCVEEKKIGQW